MRGGASKKLAFDVGQWVVGWMRTEAAHKVPDFNGRNGDSTPSSAIFREAASFRDDGDEKETKIWGIEWQGRPPVVSLSIWLEAVGK